MLFANDANKDRAKAIVGNIHRMGITNTVVSEYDGREFPQVNAFERRHEKTNILVSDLVQHKPGCTATEDG